jgi:anti-sigma regulatory factor (Ser/Thr protein kinase)
VAWHIERELAPSARSSAAARVFTADWLGGVLDPVAQDTNRAVGEATLIVSELVTNAVQAHTCELRLVLSLEPSDPAVLTISVEDDAPGTPELSSGPLTRSRGRGLLLVDALAKRWGTQWSPPGLKSVWAELTIDAQRPWPGLGRPCAVSS